MEACDLAIVGAGPAGLFAAFYAGMRGIESVCLFDALEFPGGQVQALYPEKVIYDVGGYPQVPGHELVDRLWEQARYYSPSVHLGERVQSLAPQDGAWEVGTDRGSYLARAVLLATGIGEFEPRRTGLPEVDAYEGRGLEYTVTGAEKFRGKPAVVLGGGDTALDWALSLARAGARVTLVHRRNQFRAAEGSVQEAFDRGVRPLTPAVISGASGVGVIQSVRVNRTDTEETIELPCSVLVVGYGFQTSPGPVATWGLTMEDKRVAVDAFCATSLPGVFAIGDAVRYPQKLDLIATAFAEAALAVASVKRHLDPEARLQPTHSSTLVRT